MNLINIIQEYIQENPNLSNTKLAEKILSEIPDIGYSFHTVRKKITYVKRGEVIEIQVHETNIDLNYAIVDDNYVLKTKDGSVTLSIETVDKLFYEYSEHGLNKTQTEIINNHGINVQTWHAIKNKLGLYKKSNIFSPYTLENMPKDEQEQFIQEHIERSLHDKVNIENIYRKTVLKEAKKSIKENERTILSHQTFLAELTDTLPKIETLKIHTIKNEGYVSEPIVVFLADLHFGSKVQNMHIVQDYNPKIAAQKLDEIANEINKLQSSSVNIAFLGDLIESFTGLNHATTWQSIDEGMYGANLVQKALELIMEFIGKIHNVENIFAIGGNHDRGDSNAKIDYKGEIAGVIFMFLKKWYERDTNIKVTYNHNLLNPTIDEITYILLHGHTKEAQQTSEYLAFNYGKQGTFNLIVTGHTHGLRIKGDSNKCMHIVCPAIFSGNDYSERSGWSSSSGYMIVKNNGLNKPKITINTL